VKLYRTTTFEVMGIQRREPNSQPAAPASHRLFKGTRNILDSVEREQETKETHLRVKRGTDGLACERRLGHKSGYRALKSPTKQHTTQQVGPDQGEPPHCANWAAHFFSGIVSTGRRERDSKTYRTSVGGGSGGGGSRAATSAGAPASRRECRIDASEFDVRVDDLGVGTGRFHIGGSSRTCRASSTTKIGMSTSKLLRKS
jgi:hypothetical protein